MGFAESVSEKWEAAPFVSEDYFRNVVAKAIIFRWTDRMIGRSEWYQSSRGYKAQIVTYTIAWLLNHLQANRGSGIDLDLVWRHQDVPEELQLVLSKIAPRVAGKIKDAPSTIRNVSEYCKRPACWEELSQTNFQVDAVISRVTKPLQPEASGAREHADTESVL